MGESFSPSFWRTTPWMESVEQHFLHPVDRFHQHDEYILYQSSIYRVKLFVMRRQRTIKAPTIQKSTGNVFEDIGFAKPKAKRLALLSALAIEVEKYIKGQNLTQAEAAGLFGVTQPRNSNLLNGKFHLFSIDTLIEMLLRAGIQVNIGVKKAA